jgi:hypothetical protein
MDHFHNTHTDKWTIVGVVDESIGPEVSRVELFAPGSTEPVFTVAVSDLPQFIAAMTAAALPGDLTAR